MRAFIESSHDVVERSEGAAVRWISDRGARDHYISGKHPFDGLVASTQRSPLPPVADCLN